MANAVLNKHGTAKDADPQVSALSQASGYSEDTVKSKLALGLAIVSEVVSALGLFAVSAPLVKKPKPQQGKAKRRRKKSAPLAPPVQKAEGNVVPFALAANEKPRPHPAGLLVARALPVYQLAYSEWEASAQMMLI